jgi:hypothetical protein
LFWYSGIGVIVEVRVEVGRGVIVGVDVAVKVGFGVKDDLAVGRLFCPLQDVRSI